jgi:hypothetical protein
MSHSDFSLNPKQRQEWRQKIEKANYHNIFCHCRHCQQEWIDSSFEAVCQCGSQDVEKIACWQFPDG